MIRFADISEFQTGANLKAYRAEYDVLILRAHNGNRPDYRWPAWRDEARSLNFVALGFYQYLVDERTAIEQANDYTACVGPLRANEFAILDSEEGAGDQTSRCEAWFQIVDKKYGRESSLYASESWFNDKLGGAARWRRPRWVAAYRSTEPTLPHEWWQNTDKASMAGLPGSVDGNIFHGTSQEFTKVVTGQAAVTPKLPADTQAIDIGVMPDGRQEIFVVLKSGEVQHRWNAKEGGWVPNWESLGTPGK